MPDVVLSAAQMGPYRSHMDIFVNHSGNPTFPCPIHSLRIQQALKMTQ